MTASAASPPLPPSAASPPLPHPRSSHSWPSQTWWRRPPPPAAFSQIPTSPPRLLLSPSAGCFAAPSAGTYPQLSRTFWMVAYGCSRDVCPREAETPLWACTFWAKVKCSIRSCSQILLSDIRCKATPTGTPLLRSKDFNDLQSFFTTVFFKHCPLVTSQPALAMPAAGCASAAPPLPLPSPSPLPRPRRPRPRRTSGRWGWPSWHGQRRNSCRGRGRGAPSRA